MSDAGATDQESPADGHPDFSVVHSCPECRVRSLGSLTVHSDRCSQPPCSRLLYQLTDRCPDCSGMGTWSGLDCPACLGSGKRRDRTAS